MNRAVVCLAGRPQRMTFAALLSLLIALLVTATIRADSFDLDANPDRWFRLEYVNFWTSHAALSAPLVTSGDAADLGRLGSPQTQTLLGAGDLPSSIFPAMRLTAGGWISDEPFGGELSFFATGLRATHFSAAGSASSGPLLAVPFLDVTSGSPQQSSLVVSQPGVSSGRVWANDAMGFGGLDLHGLGSLDEHILNPNASLAVLAGLRTTFLRERFTFSSGTDYLSGPSVSHNDIFMTNEAFTGLDLGMRGNYRWRRWSIEATSRAAVGATFSTTYVAAQGSLPFAYPRIQTVPGEGWFAQPSNIGRQFRQAFSVVPATQLRVGYALTSRVRLTVGYEAFFWTRVLRAPNQLNPQINLSQTFGPLVGPALPAARPNYTNFWAQGFTAGVQIGF
ncbi:MAG TPA: BBP7 family outer membrane beta-barrel protein [Pirellulales bacterium]|nr:BBP7 family outer membrane beta-barrel protein [Pirellulales bacterium]